MTRYNVAVLGNDGTVGGPGGSPLSSSVDNASSPGTYTRASTGQTKAGQGGVYAPSLRDVVSLLDFVDAADASNHGNGTTNDSSLFTAAYSAFSTVGGGVLVVTPHRMNGSQATWTLNHTNPPSHLTISAYGAQFQALPGGTNPLFVWTTVTGSSGVNQITDFRLLGGTFLGSGSESNSQGVLAFDRCADITVRDTLVTNWGTTNGPSIFSLTECQRARYENNTLTNVCLVLGGNALGFSFGSANGTIATSPVDLLVRGNIVRGCGAMPIDIETLYTNYANVPLRMVIASNDLECNNQGSATGNANGIMLEYGGASADTRTIQQVIISHNKVSYTGPNTGSAAGIVVAANGSPLPTIGTVMMDIIIDGNHVDSTRAGISVRASRCSMTGNIVTAQTTGIGIIPPSSSATISHVSVTGGMVHMLAGASTTAGIQVGAAATGVVTDVRIDTDVHFDSGATAGYGIGVENALRVEIKASVSLAATYGIFVTGDGTKSCGEIFILPGTRVYNPSCGGSSPGILVSGTMTDNVWINETYIRDDRGGSAVMTYAVQNTSTGSNVIVGAGCTFIGFVTARFTGKVFDGDSWDIIIPLDARLYTVTTALGSSNTANGSRCVVPKTGLVTAIYVYIGIASGNMDVAIYDSMASSSLKRLWSSGSVAVPGTGWQQIGTPNLLVFKGQVVDLAVAFDNTTATFGRTPAALPIGLPTGLVGASGFAPKLTWSQATSFPLPDPITPASTQGQTPAIMCHVA